MSGLVLAGGGHSHALLLRRWAMHPHKRPPGLITLVSRSSTALYSGMVPGLIAGLYDLESAAIDLRALADQAGVALVVAEITGLDPAARRLQLEQRPDLSYEWLSLNLGAVTRQASASDSALVPIKPLEPALAYLCLKDGDTVDSGAAGSPFRVVGSGLAAVETVLALRQRWPQQPLELQVHAGHLHPSLRKALQRAGVQRLSSKAPSNASAGLLCTGSSAPPWLARSGLPCDPARGRVLTEATLEIVGHPHLFAAGDCAEIISDPRPASGVWAVRAASPLARNLEAAVLGQRLQPWRPQRRALQLLGGFRNGQPTAWALHGSRLIGPHPLLWRWKRAIDARFMALFQRPSAMQSKAAMACRGCAAKLPAEPLEQALRDAGLARDEIQPEDAAVLPLQADERRGAVIQSVDGFPALVSDPWLNGRLTALHACSDLWACGARVLAAQAVVTLPQAPPAEQASLLAQTLAGIRSALEPQCAPLIGGHTLEARDGSAAAPLSRSLQVSLSVTGQCSNAFWRKTTLQAGDHLLLSRPLGTGVLFAAAMAGAARPAALDTALEQMATSQHPLLNTLLRLTQEQPGAIHAATDITGFGLLGHLGEMLHDPSLRVNLTAASIPALPQALELLEDGHASSLAPANRNAWTLLDATEHRDAAVTLLLGDIPSTSPQARALLELLVDPQTCGPLLIGVPPGVSQRLEGDPAQPWRRIGVVRSAETPSH